MRQAIIALILAAAAIVAVSPDAKTQAAPPAERTVITLWPGQNIEPEDWPEGDAVLRAVDNSVAVPVVVCLPPATGSGREIRLYHGAGMGDILIDGMGSMIAFNGGGGSVYRLAIQYGTVYLVDIGPDEWAIYGTTPAELVVGQ